MRVQVKVQAALHIVNERAAPRTELLSLEGTIKTSQWGLGKTMVLGKQ